MRDKDLALKTVTPDYKKHAPRSHAGKAAAASARGPAGQRAERASGSFGGEPGQE